MGSMEMVECRVIAKGGYRSLNRNETAFFPKGSIGALAGVLEVASDSPDSRYDWHAVANEIGIGRRTSSWLHVKGYDPSSVFGIGATKMDMMVRAAGAQLDSGDADVLRSLSRKRYEDMPFHPDNVEEVKKKSGRPKAA